MDLLHLPGHHREFIVLDDGPVNVTNPYSGESCMLIPEAIAVYDFIKGAEMTGTSFHKELDYFMRKWPSEYMTLLD